MPSVAVSTPRDIGRISSRSRLSLVGTPRRAPSLLDLGSVRGSSSNRRASSIYEPPSKRRASVIEQASGRVSSINDPSHNRRSFRLSLDPKLSLLDHRSDGSRIPLLDPARLAEPARIVDHRQGNVHTPSTSIPKRRRSGSGLPPNRRHQTNPPPALSTSQQPQILHSAILASSFSSAGPSPANPDTRPLRDKTYQLLISQEILDFLAANRFELETGHVISAKSLARPTQKDFVFMYKFLYQRIDPSYAFIHAVDVDVLATLRLVQYPYLDTLNRSQISAVGGHHWPFFLGVLYYLVKVNLHLAVADIECSDLFAFEDPLDATVTNYYESAYTAYLAGADDFSHETMVMELEFSRYFEQTESDIVALDSEIDQASRHLSDLEQQLLHLDDARKMLAALLQDVETLGEYVRHVEERQPRWQQSLEKLASDIESTNRELTLVHQSIAQLDRDMQSKGISFDAIDRAVAELEEVERKVHELERAINTSTETVAREHHRASEWFIPLESFVAEYGAKILSFAVLHSSYFPQDQLQLMQITIAPQLLDSFHNRLVGAAEMTVPPLPQIETALRGLLSSLDVRRQDVLETSRNLQVDVDAANEAVRLVQDQADLASEKLASHVSTREEAEEQIQRTNSAYKAEIEKRQRQVRTANTLENEAYVELELEFQNSRAAYYDRLAAIERDRARWLGYTQEVAEFVIGLKMRYQSTLNGTIDLVTHEFDAVMLFNRDHSLH